MLSVFCAWIFNFYSIPALSFYSLRYAFVLLLCLVPWENNAAAKLSSILQNLILNREEKKNQNRNKSDVLSAWQRLNYGKNIRLLNFIMLQFLVELVTEAEKSSDNFCDSFWAKWPEQQTDCIASNMVTAWLLTGLNCGGCIQMWGLKKK